MFREGILWANASLQEALQRGTTRGHMGQMALGPPEPERGPQKLWNAFATML